MIKEADAAALLAAVKEALEWAMDDGELVLDTENRRKDWRDVLAARQKMLEALIGRIEEAGVDDDDDDKPMPRPKFTGRTR